MNSVNILLFTVITSLPVTIVVSHLYWHYKLMGFKEPERYVGFIIMLYVFLIYCAIGIFISVWSDTKKRRKKRERIYKNER